MSIDLEAHKKNLLEIAIEAHDRGFWVHPLTPFNVKKGESFIAPWGANYTCAADQHAGKKPMYSDWQSKRRTKEEIVNAFSLNPTLNLGVVCGVAQKLICVDIDFKNDGNIWLEQYNELLEGGIWEKTGNGYHIYFNPPSWSPDALSSLHNGVIASGVELKADGTQVVCFPSYHPTALTAEGLPKQYGDESCPWYLVEDEADELPEEFFRKVLDDKRELDRRRGVGDSNAHLRDNFSDHPGDIDRVSGKLARVVAIEGQGGQERTFRAACMLRDHGLSPHVAIKLMREWNKHNAKPSWSDHELLGIIDNAYRYANGVAGRDSIAADVKAFESFQETVQFDTSLFDSLPPLPGKKKTTTPDGPSFPDGDLFDFKNPKLAAKILYKENPFMYYIHDFWHVYSKKEKCWIVIENEEMLAAISALIMRKVDIHENVKPHHDDAIYREIRNLVIADTRREKPKLNSWVKMEDPPQGEFVVFRNGMLQLGTSELIPHDPHYFTTNCLDFNYDPDAKSPVFFNFLRSIWGHEQAIEGARVASQADQLQRTMGYFLSENTEAHKFALFIGVSRAGKGVLEHVFKELIGENNTDSKTLDALGSTHGTASLLGKRLVLISDVGSANSPNAKNGMDVIKNIAGGDPLPINPKYKKSATIKNTSKLLITANRFPKFIDSGDAFTNRLLLFNFTKTFFGKEDRLLAKKLKAEIAGIFNWAHEGYKSYRQDGVLTNCPQVMSFMKDMKDTMNPLGAFVDTLCTVYNPMDKDTWIGYDETKGGSSEFPECMTTSFDDLYDAYVKCLDADNMKFKLSRKAFLMNVQHELYRSGLDPSWWKKRKRIYTGMTVEQKNCVIGLHVEKVDDPKDFQDMLEAGNEPDFSNSLMTFYDDTEED